MSFTQRTTHYSKILSKNINKSLIDCTKSYYNTFSRNILFIHSQGGASVFYKHIKLIKTTVIKQVFYSFSGGFFTFFVLFFYSFFPTAKFYFFFFLFQFFLFLIN